MEITISQKLGLASIRERGKLARALYSLAPVNLGGIEVVEFRDYATHGERLDALEIVRSRYAQPFTFRVDEFDAHADAFAKHGRTEDLQALFRLADGNVKERANG